MQAHRPLDIGPFWRQDIAPIATVFFIIAAFIWVMPRSSHWETPVLAILLIAALIYGHKQQNQSLHDVGFRLDTLPAAALMLAPLAAIVIAFTVYVGHILGSTRFPAGPAAALSAAKLIVFGLAQEYVLLAFFYRRIDEMLPSRALALIAAALVFSVLHLPNPFLVTFTFFAGLLSAIVYVRAPNLWVNGVVHGLLSYCIYYSLSADITGGLRVGPAYWTR
jgi:membrane protease YdiL (CAAX protease family)